MSWNQAIEKLEKRIEEVLGKRLSACATIGEYRAWRDERTEEIHDLPPAEESAVMTAGEVWGSEDGYLWLECQVQVPEAKEGEKTAGSFDFNSIHEGYASGFEAMLYINGQPYQGVDENHSIVILDKFAGQTVTLLFKLWAGITGGPKFPIYHQIKAGTIGYLHPDVEEFGLLAQMALLQAKELPEVSAGKAILMNALEESFKRILWVESDEDLWRASIKEAMESLKGELSKYPDRERFQVHCVGHTHIDLAWMWRVKHTKEKGMRSFSTALRLFEEFPDFRFYHSTPQLYQYIKELSPELYEEIKERIKEGKWEPGGGMWVEADCNLPNGESLVRQILYGKRFFKEEFGVDTKFLWLPDAFGFPFCLPQLMKKSGMDTFFSSKLSWNKQNRFPHDTFRWRGMDGSEVMAYFLTTPAYGFPTQEWAVTYNGDIHPKPLKGAYEIYQEKKWNQDVMMTYGHGDGGGGCTRDMVQKIHAMEQVPFGPRISYSHAQQFFDKVRENIEGKEPLPVWEDELYLEYHRGTFTSQAFVKRANRKIENRLRNLEYLQVYKDAVCGTEIEDVDNLEEHWKLLLKNQFHDIIPGSSIHEVYEDAKKDYDWLNEDLDRVEEKLWTDSSEDGYTVLNTGNWGREALVELPEGEKRLAWKLADGTALKASAAHDGKILVQLPEIQPLSGCVLVPGEETTGETVSAEETLANVNMEARTAETERYLISWNAQGGLERLYDKALDFEVFCGEAGNRLVVYEDKPLMFDAWDIDSYYKEKPYTPELTQVEEIENTALRTILRFTYNFGKSVIAQDMVLTKGKEQIDFVTRADWKERQCLLKAYFPVNVHAREAVFDTQFGNIKRSTTRNTTVDAAKFEVCGHRFADISQRDRGMALLNDCKYGHDVLDSTIGLTLIKSAVDPDDRADLGEHIFTYSICPHSGNWYDNGVQEKAFALNTPLMLHKGQHPKLAQSWMKFEGDFVELDAVKPAEDGNGFILRFHEYAGGDSRVSIEAPENVKGFTECDILENAVEEITAGNRLETAVKPYEIKTYRVWVK